MHVACAPVITTAVRGYLTNVAQTGKTLVLTKVLPALIAEDELFGVGRQAEARIFLFSTDGFDRKNGETGFLKSLLTELLLQADSIGAIGAANMQRVRRDMHELNDPFACLKLFVDMLPHDVQHFILVDEVQNFFLLTKPDGSLDGPSIDQMRGCVSCDLPPRRHGTARTHACTHAVFFTPPLAAEYSRSWWAAAPCIARGW